MVVVAGGEHGGGRQAGQRGGAQRGGQRVRAVGRIGQVVAPVPGHRAAVEQQRVVVLADGRGVRGVVGVRVDQQLVQDRGAAALASQQGEGGGQVAARAVPADRQPGRVGAEFGGVLGDPLGGGGRVVHGGREGVLGGEPVARRDGDAADGVGQAAADRVAGVERAEGPAATEQVEQDGQRGCGCGIGSGSGSGSGGRVVDPQWQWAARARDGELLDGADRFRVPGGGPDVGEVGGAGLGEGAGVERGRTCFGALPAQGLGLGVQWQGSVPGIGPPVDGGGVVTVVQRDGDREAAAVGGPGLGEVTGSRCPAIRNRRPQAAAGGG